MQYNPILHKLANGVTVILDPMPAATAYVIVRFNTGSLDESPSEYGITHFCEHMLCKGTPRFPTGTDLKNYVEYNSGTCGACTGHEDITFYGHILAENADKLLDVFADQLQNSLFDTDVMERERSVIADELRRAMDDPSRRRAEFVFRSISDGDRPAYRTLGTFENIASFTKDRLRAFMARRMTAKNCVVCVSGAIENPDALLAFIERKFSWLPALDAPRTTPPPKYKSAVAHLPQEDNTNSHVCVLVPQLYELKAENRFRRMCITRFNDYLERELFRVLRGENGLVYGVNRESFFIDGLGINGFSAQTAPENIGRMVALMARTARGVTTTKPITDKFLMRYKAGCKLGDALWVESPKRRCKGLVNEYFDCNGLLYDYHAYRQMGMSITAKDVIENSREYFNRPVSIITSGADFDANVMKIWRENFGAPQNISAMIKAKDDKCH